MKVRLILCFALLAGAFIGVGLTVLELRSSQESFALGDERPADKTENKSKEDTAKNDPDGKAPKVELVDGEMYEFGSMERLSTLTHVFRIKNAGDLPLELRKGRTTCKCTVGSISADGLAPGDTAEVEIEWTGQTRTSNPNFQQTVEILTNDPDHDVVRLIIRGYVTESLRALPEEVTIGRISSNFPSEAEFRLYGFRCDTVEILETSFGNKGLSDRFEIAFEPLSEAEVAEEKGASCGLLAKLGIKSGLPLGPINQTIRIKAKADKEVEFDVPITGRVESDILIASTTNFDVARNLLSFGRLKQHETASATISMFVRGPHRHETSLSVGTIDPEGYLQVEISPPEELNKGKTVKYAVTIKVLVGLEPINRMGSRNAKLGRVVLDTTHPQTKQIPLSVKFAVE